ncbi:hypothetical protein TRFO_04606 [Tritrichomonas foetus]|uniref:MULE transposase domain-containing protein n=1 Tax=Tritrichomonas foetus TaxID=1144522 RepID=A0A1J4KEY9_9EUKA|nr:hypothetical protein TRFO_04606 [Tritrichomonas foetus]|eukprot:OHT09504.1 hypothetical protein TRFO_04606 [Tritrichomonas foetus]
MESEVFFSDHMLGYISLYPPWTPQMIKAYHSPSILDDTFCADKLKITSALAIDGELHTQLIRIVVRATEDSISYGELISYIIEFSPQNEELTIIGDEIEGIDCAINNLPSKPIHRMICLKQYIESLMRTKNFRPFKTLINHFYMTSQGKYPLNTFLKEVHENEIKYHKEDNLICYDDIKAKLHRWKSVEKGAHRRKGTTSQSVEMFNAKMKNTKSDCLSMLNQAVKWSTK